MPADTALDIQTPDATAHNAATRPAARLGLGGGIKVKAGVGQRYEEAKGAGGVVPATPVAAAGPAAEQEEFFQPTGEPAGDALPAAKPDMKTGSKTLREILKSSEAKPDQGKENGGRRRKTLGDDGHQLVGSIVSIALYKKMDDTNAWCVMYVKPEGEMPPGWDPALPAVKVAGVVPFGIKPAKGDQVQATGRVQDDPKYGRQFKTRAIGVVAPTTAKGIFEWIRRRGVEGVGVTSADKLAQHYGEDIVNVMNDPEALMAAGITQRQAEAIVEGWRAQSTNGHAKTYMWLLGLGIGEKTAQSIIYTYGDRTAAVVRADPWRLAVDISGIGFLKADSIALKLGASRTSPTRLQAGVLHVLRESEGQGDCGLGAKELMLLAMEALAPRPPKEGPGADDEIVRRDEKRKALAAMSPEDRKALTDGITKAIVALRNDKVIVYDNKFPAALIRRTAIHDAEVMVSSRIGEGIAYGEVIKRSRDGEAFRKHVELTLGQVLADKNARNARLSEQAGLPFRPLVLAEQQHEAVLYAAEENLLVITGGPGVGKSTTLDTILDTLRALNPEMKLGQAAPTGRAARRMEEATGRQAQTIQRLLGYTPVFGKAAAGGKTSTFRYNRDNPLDLDVVVIDEVSMMDIELAASLFEAIDFSRTKLILIGDPDQLPSVGPGRVLADALAVEAVPKVKLTRVYRQGPGSGIGQAAALINAGKALPRKIGEDFLIVKPALTEEDRQALLNVPEADRKAEGERLAEQKILPKIVQLVTEEAARMNFVPLRDVQVLASSYDGPNGINAINAALKEHLNPAKEDPTHTWTYKSQHLEVSFSVGDRVMQTRNNYDKEVMNSEIGSVREIIVGQDHAGKIIARGIIVDFGGMTVPYEAKDVSELTLAYCISCHKSQGGEFPCVVVALPTYPWTMLQRNSFYTGITRGKKQVYVVGQDKAVIQAIRNNESSIIVPGTNVRRKRNTLLAEHIRHQIETQLGRAKANPDAYVAQSKVEAEERAETRRVMDNVVEMDPFRVLGLPRTAGLDQIKEAYRTLAKKHHPDLNPGNPQAEEEFKKINIAHNLLSDPKTRARYGVVVQDNRPAATDDLDAAVPF